MAKKIADLLIKLGADTLGIEKMSGDVKKQLRSLQKDLHGFGKRMSLSITAPLTAAAGASVYLADIQMQAERRLLVALRGRQDVQQRLIRQAGELQSRSLFGDEVLIGQQAYLASLGMTEQQIGRVIEASAQLSSATGMSLETAVKNLAKTYGGLTGRLGESIPKLRELTSEQLKNGKAVDFILENYKGFAEGAAATGLGPLKQLKNSLGDLGEEIGAILMPAVQQIVSWLKDFVEWLQSLTPATKTTVIVLGGLAAAIGPVSLGLGGILKLLPMLKVGFLALTGPVGAVTLAVSLLAGEMASLKAYGQEFYRNFTDKAVKKYVDSGMSVEELQALRARYAAAVEEGDQFPKFSFPSIAMFLGNADYRKNMLAGVFNTARLGSSEMAAIDEAIRILQTNPLTEPPPEQLGLLGKLQEKIADLEKAKKKATDPKQISELNREIRNTVLFIEKIDKNGRIEGLDISTSKALMFSDEDIDKQKRIIETLQSMANKFPDNPDYVASQGRAEDRLSLMQWGRVTPLAFDPNAINPPESDWTEAEENFRNNLSNFIASARELIFDFAPMLNELFQGLAVGIGEGLGNMFSGDGTFDNLLASFGKAVGQFLVSIGKQLIAAAAIIKTIKQTLLSIFSNPWAAFAAGIAAIAAGTAMINAFGKKAGKGVALAEGGLAYGPTMALVGDNRGAGSDPEVIAPLSKLRQYGLGRQAIEFVGGQFRLSGSDLWLSIRREDAKITYVNALG